MAFHITGDPHADEVLDEYPFAVVAGMLLDQQYPMEHAFRGPAKVLDRFGTLDPARIAAADPEEFAALAPRRPPCTGSRARWPPGSRRWPPWSSTSTTATRPAVDEADDGADLLKRIQRAAGLRQAEGPDLGRAAGQAARRTPDGWEAAAGGYAEEGYRSVADVTDPVTLQKVRDYKKAKKAEALA